MIYGSTLARRLGDRLDAHPDLWRLVQTVRYGNSRVIRNFVTAEHDLVLEGYPRCGNSFAERAFIFANGRTRRWAIATHAHRIAQLALAVRYKLPTLIVTRAPEPAVCSFAALTYPKADADRTEIARFIHDKTRYYADYYSVARDLRDAIVLSDFVTTTTAFGRVIGALNDRFGTDFIPFSDDPDDVAQIFATSRTHLSPNAERDTVKASMLDLYHAPANAAARERAEQVYTQIREAAL